jgi:hypothetical protein
MHLQQTKRASAETGGPQYYFHHLDNAIRTYLRVEGVVPVALVTPYGATKSHFYAVGKDHKLVLRHGTLVAGPGKVGHDRIQMGAAGESIGEAIRGWFKLPAGQFERIDITVDTIDDAFYLTPIKVKYSASNTSRTIAVSRNPLTFERHYVSRLWRDQIKRLGNQQVEWSFREIARIVRDHLPAPSVSHIKEEDLLRASGPLERLGVQLGPYVG